MSLVLDAPAGHAAAFKIADLGAAFCPPPEPRLRRVRAHDGQAMQRFVMGLSAASRRMRFHGAVNACTPGLLRQLTQADDADHVAIIASVEGAEGERFVGEARYHASGASAEFAIAVADGHQGRGLADRLLRALLQAAGGAGLAMLYGDVLNGNVRMAGLLQRHGFAIDACADVDPGVTRWQRALPQSRGRDDRPAALPGASGPPWPARRPSESARPAA
ncbi:MAG: GNAT family N-acetyltransferase [Pseudomonadota bacterium]